MPLLTFTVYNLSASINGTFTVLSSFSVTVDDSDDGFGVGDDAPSTETGAFPTIVSTTGPAPANWIPGATFVFGGERELDNSGTGSEDALLPKVNGAWQFQTAVQHPDFLVPLVIGNTYTSTGFGNVNEEIMPVCFVSGTMITTSKGLVAVENITPGTQVLTRDNGCQTVQWVGSREICALGKVAPVTFSPGTIGNSTELSLSPQHRVLIRNAQCALHFGVEEALVAAIHLVNGTTVRQVPTESVTYVHIMFDKHEIIYANGASTESFYPGSEALNALEAEAKEEILELFPEINRDLRASYGTTARTTLSGSQAILLR